MSTFFFTITFLSLLNYGDGASNTSECPNGCFCDFSNFFSELKIDCSQGHLGEDRLFQQLNIFLIANPSNDRLTSLTITNTPLSRIPPSICYLQSLTILRLDRNRVAEIPDNCFNRLTKLVILSLASNLIRSLQNGSFDGLQELESLNLAYNQISFIALGVFSNASDLTRLRTLNLNNNNLTSLEPWWYYRCIQGSLDSPVNVLLNTNLISNATNRLQFHFQCGMKQPFGYLELANNRFVHITDVLQSWNIDGFANYSCLSNIIGRIRRFKIGMYGLYYACDCVDFKIYAWARMFQHGESVADGVRCDKDQFVSASGNDVRANRIPLIEFVCNLPDECPSNCQCVYRPANATLHINCFSSNISSLPLHLPQLPKSYVRYKLDFSKNKLLRRLEHRSYFANTSILDVSSCSLTEISAKDLKDLLRFKIVTNFRGNMLSSLSKDVVDANTSATLFLGRNPWKCSCDNSWMISWLQSLSDKIRDPGDIICRSPSRMRGRNVLKSTADDFCDDPEKRILTITVSTAATVVAFIVVLIIAGLLVYKFREKCYKSWKFHPFDRDECVGEDMDYDVFLCCSSEDHRPHALRIVNLIESKGYRVCYHERDFLPGSLITDSICSSIERSKRTVCFVSNNFLKSSFCMTEFDIAYHHIVAVKRKKRLVVLMALDNPTELYANDASDTATLRHYLRQYTYIDYTADDWLDRLLYALPLHGLMQNIEDHPTDDVQLIQDIQMH